MTVVLELKNQMIENGTPSGEGGQGSPRIPKATGPKPLGYVPELEFPKFDGSHCRLWIRKCSKYFHLCKIADDQKVDFASLYMIDKAEKWVTSYLSVRKSVDWAEFVVDLSARFKDDTTFNVVEQFNKLHQTDSLETYIDELEDLSSVVLQHHHSIPDEYILESFVGGLKPGVKPFVKALKPTTISAAVEIARLQEETLKALQPKSTKFSPFSSKPLPPLLPTPSLPTQNPTPFSTFKLTPKNAKNFKYIPADVRAEKIAKGLCYYCDQPYSRNHKCQFQEPQLFTVEIAANTGQQADIDEDSENDVDIEPLISVNAPSENQNFQTMRVQGKVKDKLFHILVDSGSTHNFLDLTLAKKLGCNIESILSQAVGVADGNHLQCQHVCKCFQWSMQGQHFEADVLLISLGGCDMVLGVQWLTTLGPICWDFKALMMEFMLNGNQFVLKGILKRLRWLKDHHHQN